MSSTTRRNEVGQQPALNSRVNFKLTVCWDIAAFETFLEKFKTSPEQTITHAIGQINIDEDDLSDEYDFMDQDDEAHEQRRKEKAAAKLPKHKYADIMQKLADRTIDEVLIELDDIASVRPIFPWQKESN